MRFNISIFWRHSTYMCQHVKREFSLIISCSDCQMKRLTVSEVGLSDRCLIACLFARQTAAGHNDSCWRSPMEAVSRLTWLTLTWKRTWDGHHWRQLNMLMNCSASRQLKWLLVLMSTPHATSKRDRHILTPWYGRKYTQQNVSTRSINKEAMGGPWCSSA